MQTTYRPRYTESHPKFRPQSEIANQPHVLEPDFEQGQQLRNLPLSRPDSVTAPLHTPGSPSSLSHDEIDDDSDSRGASSQRPLKLYQAFAMIVPAMILAALDYSPDPPIERQSSSNEGLTEA